MTKEYQILGISGSLRKASYNTGLLRAAQELLPEGMRLELADISQFPLYNEDVSSMGLPEAVKIFQAQIRAADGLMIATPEYNFSIPGVLKNAIDWASRPLQGQPFDGKPVAILGAGGRMGTVRAQVHLRQIAVFLNMHPLNRPEVLIQQARDKFDADGNLTDTAARQAVKDLLVALAGWIARLEPKEVSTIG